MELFDKRLVRSFPFFVVKATIIFLVWRTVGGKGGGLKRKSINIKGPTSCEARPCAGVGVATKLLLPKKPHLKPADVRYSWQVEVGVHCRNF